MSEDLEDRVKKEEYILCAAVHYDDKIVHEHQPRNIKRGIVVAGRRHHNCIMTAMILSNGTLKQNDQVQGFITSKDRFVNRKEAFQVAKKVNQFLIPEFGETEEKSLISEDLW